MAHESGFLGKIARKVLGKLRTTLIQQHANRDVGWWTTGQEKADYCRKISERLATGFLWYARDMVCPAPWTPKNGDPDKVIEATKRKFEGQIARLKFVEQESTSALSPAKIGASGASDKHGKRARGFTDDLAIIFGMGLRIFSLLRRREVQGVPYGSLQLD